MKNTLSSFGQKQFNEPSSSGLDQSEKDAGLENSDISDEVLEKYNSIKNMSQSEASAALAQEVLRQKQNGSFDFNKLLTQVESLKGMLPEKDYGNLKRMLDTLK